MTRDLEHAGHGSYVAFYIRDPWVRSANKKEFLSNEWWLVGSPFAICNLSLTIHDLRGR